jgi:hypothetical protein
MAAVNVNRTSLRPQTNPTLVKIKQTGKKFHEITTINDPTSW